MKIYKYSTKLLIICGLLMFTILQGCSDDPASADPDDAPMVPEATPAEVDISIFAGANAPFEPEYEAFNNASVYAQGANATLMGNTMMGESFLSFTEVSDDPTYSNGEWEWVFTQSFEGEFITVRTIAREVSNGTEWEIWISGDFDGEEVEEYLFMSGFNSHDGMSGNWSFYFEEDDTSASLTYEWDITSETEYELSAYSDYLEYSMVYERSGADNTLEITYDAADNVLIYWNSDTGTGYIIENGVQTCWNSSFQETSCS